MELTWLGTAGFKIEIGSTVLYLDPFLSRSKRASDPALPRVEEIVRADCIFCTHGHFDHLYDVPAIAKRTGARVFAPSRACETLRDAGVPDGQLRPVQGVETIGLPDFRVRTIPLSHTRFDTPLALRTLARGGWRMLLDAGRLLRFPPGEVMGYLFTVKDCSWCFMGSAGYEASRIRGLKPDLALVPLQGHSDIARIAAEIVALLAPRWAIPHHHDDFYPPVSQAIDPAPFIAEVQRRCPTARVWVPQMGQALRYERGELSAAPGQP